MSIEALERKIEELMQSGREYALAMDKRHDEMITVLRKYIEHTKPTTATSLYMTGLESVLKDFTGLYQNLAHNVRELGVSAARQEAYLSRIDGAMSRINDKVCYHAGDCPMTHGDGHQAHRPLVVPVEPE